MNGSARATAAARRGGSSFGPGPRRGTDPEGGERSAWKGLTGPSGLNLDHSRIPDIQKKVYEVLAPLVVAAQEPIPLSTFTQKCCDLLLPVLERQQELGPHEFKSQWGRLNEFVCPELARRAGLGDGGYSREHKTVKIDLSVPSSSQAAGRRGAASAASSSPGSDVPPGFAPRPAVHAAPAAPAVTAAHAAAATATGPTLAPGQQARGLPVPIALLPGSAPAGSAGAPGPVAVPPHAVAGLAVLPPAPCAYCQGPHSMKNCRDFHHMLQSIYQAGYQQGLAAAQQVQQAQQAAPPPAST
ncbi:hypothetical protein ABPG75_006902 [Micractinium tetrahymenae]